MTASARARRGRVVGAAMGTSSRAPDRYPSGVAFCPVSEGRRWLPVSVRVPGVRLGRSAAHCLGDATCRTAPLPLPGAIATLGAGYGRDRAAPSPEGAHCRWALGSQTPTGGMHRRAIEGADLPDLPEQLQAPGASDRLGAVGRTQLVQEAVHLGAASATAWSWRRHPPGPVASSSSRTSERLQQPSGTPRVGPVLAGDCHGLSHDRCGKHPRTTESFPVGQPGDPRQQTLAPPTHGVGHDPELPSDVRIGRPTAWRRPR